MRVKAISRFYQIQVLQSKSFLGPFWGVSKRKAMNLQNTILNVRITVGCLNYLNLASLKIVITFLYSLLHFLYIINTWWHSR